MNRKTFEASIEGHPLKFISCKKDEWENKSIPSLVLAYEKFWDDNRRPPSQQEYVETFCDINKLKCEEGLKARLYRAYPSLVRDHHLMLLADEHFDAAFNGGFLDRSGVDVLIVHDGVVLPVAAFVASPRGFAMRQRKKFGKNGSVEVFTLPMRIREATHCGDYHLYGQLHIDMLVAEIEKRKQLNTTTTSRSL